MNTYKTVSRVLLPLLSMFVTACGSDAVDIIFHATILKSGVPVRNRTGTISVEYALGNDAHGPLERTAVTDDQGAIHVSLSQL